jgi:UDP-N-acetyl-D-mannosaminuronic acid transferase (WecB/TagA/CpsF family)
MARSSLGSFWQEGILFGRSPVVDRMCWTRDRVPVDTRRTKLEWLLFRCKVQPEAYGRLIHQNKFIF